MQSPYTPLPPTMELPKKRVGITKKKCKSDNLSPLNLGNAFAYNNVGGDDVVITGVHDTGIYFTYENVDPNCNTPPENGSNVTLMASKHTQAKDFIHENGSTKSLNKTKELTGLKHNDLQTKINPIQSLSGRQNPKSKV
ncbi:hypothetical protein Tco_0936014 [Tanacetum coccineum]